MTDIHCGSVMKTRPQNTSLNDSCRVTTEFYDRYSYEKK